MAAKQYALPHQWRVSNMQQRTTAFYNVCQIKVVIGCLAACSTAAGMTVNQYAPPLTNNNNFDGQHDLPATATVRYRRPWACAAAHQAGKC